MSLWLTHMLWFDILWEKGINESSLSNLFSSPKSMSLNQSWKRSSLVGTDTVQVTFAFNQPYLGKGLMKLLLILNVLSMNVFMTYFVLYGKERNYRTLWVIQWCFLLKVLSVICLDISTSRKGSLPFDSFPIVNLIYVVMSRYWKNVMGSLLLHIYKTSPSIL